VPDDAWVCLNNLSDLLGPVDDVKKTVRSLRIPYEHTSTCVRTEALYCSGGPVSLVTRGSGVVSVYAHPTYDVSAKRSTLLLLRPADAQHFIMLTTLSVRSALISLMRNVRVIKDDGVWEAYLSWICTTPTTRSVRADSASPSPTTPATGTARADPAGFGDLQDECGTMWDLAPRTSGVA
jgi:hypothetical protein